MKTPIFDILMWTVSILAGLLSVVLFVWMIQL
jgi:hypothetical protein